MAATDARRWTKEGHVFLENEQRRAGALCPSLRSHSIRCSLFRIHLASPTPPSTTIDHGSACELTHFDGSFNVSCVPCAEGLWLAKTTADREIKNLTAVVLPALFDNS